MIFFNSVFGVINQHMVLGLRNVLECNQSYHNEQNILQERAAERSM